MIRWLKNKYCDRYHVWASAVATNFDGTQTTLAQECVECGRHIITEKGRELLSTTAEGRAFIAKCE